MSENTKWDTELMYDVCYLYLTPNDDMTIDIIIAIGNGE